jgi:hypothetical protein
MNVSYNGSSVISWNSYNATSCSASGGTNGWSGNKNTSGTFYTGALTNTITFYINCENSTGSVNSSVTVSVQAQTCQDTSAINYGGILPCTYPQICQDTTAINYQGTLPCRYLAPTCQNPSAINYGGALPCTFAQTCQDTSAINYGGTLPCRYQSQLPNPTVTLYANPMNVSYNGSSVISWNSYNATSCSASGGTNGWSGNKSTSGTFYTGALTNTITFYINCSNSTGSVNDSVTVNVDNNYNYNQQNNNQLYVNTNSATNLTASSATLNGYLNLNGNGSSFATTWFNYGTNTNFGYTTPQNSYNYGLSNYNATISGLTPNTTYYFRAVAQNSQGTVYGNTLSFTTINDYIYNPPVNNQPTVVVFANQTNIPYNGTSTISWITTNATSCVASGGSIGWAGTKSIGSGSFYTGSLTTSRTYTMTCSNSFGSATDSETISVRGQTTTVATQAPALTSLVLITSSVNRNQPIVPTLDNTRPHPGDEINYTVDYQNIGTGAITGLTLQIALPQEVSYLSSNGNSPSVFGNTLTFNLGTLRANGQGTVTVRVLVRNDATPGANLNFPAILSYINPSNQPQSVNANVSAQVWSEPTPIVGVTTESVTPLLGATVFGAGFLPTNIFGWLLLLILVLLLILIGKYLLGSNQLFPFRKETITTFDHFDQPLGKKITKTTLE